MSRIPKIIHYCWFGGAEKNDLIKKCMQSWAKYCPDYELVEWNEKNFDVSVVPYVNESYSEKKWAFVSDYVRIWALNQYGGVYLDTDVEITKSLDCFLEHEAFTGFEKEDSPFTAVFGCRPKHPFAKLIMDSYKGRHFRLENGTFDLRTNTMTVTNLLVEEYGIKLDNSLQYTADGLVIYPNDYFCPKSHSDNKVRLTENTYAIHWFDGSWIDIKDKLRHNKVQKLNLIFGDRVVSNVFGIMSCMKNEGFYRYIKKRIGKLMRKKN